MKKLLLSAVVILLAVSCGHRVRPDGHSLVFYATMENRSAAGDYPFWMSGDSISVFYKNNVHTIAVFSETDGDQGIFKAPAAPESGREAGYVYAVYPYHRSVTLGNDGRLGVYFPTVQNYEGNTYAHKANVMVAVSTDEDLDFRNVGGYVHMQLYGPGVQVAILELDTNEEEPVSGQGWVTVSPNGDPSFTPGDANTKSYVYLDCIYNPVTIGSDEEHATDFWLAVPPVKLDKGFTVYVVDPNDREYPISVTESVEFKRTHIIGVEACKVEFPEASKEDIEADLAGTYIINSTSYYASEGLGPYSDEITLSYSDKPDKGPVALTGSLGITENIELYGDYDVSGKKFSIPSGQVLGGFYTDDSKTKICWLKLYLGDDKYFYTDDILFNVTAPHSLEFAYAKDGLDLLFLGFVDDAIDGSYERLIIKSIAYKPTKAVAAAAKARGYDTEHGLDGFRHRAGALHDFKPAGELSGLVRRQFPR